MPNFIDRLHHCYRTITTLKAEHPQPRPIQQWSHVRLVDAPYDWSDDPTMRPRPFTSLVDLGWPPDITPADAADTAHDEEASR